MTRPATPGALPIPAAATPRGRVLPTGSADAPLTRLLTVGYVVVLAMTTVFSVAWLGIGGWVAVAAYSPSVQADLAVAAAGSGWARGVLAAVARSEPPGQALSDYLFSVLSLGLAVVLLARARGSWVARLLALAMVGSAGAFNLQAHGATVAVEQATGVAIGQAHQVQLHGVACAAYIMALLLFPTGRWRLTVAGQGSGPPNAALLAVAAGVTLLVVGVGTALLPHTVSCILFFGFAVPLAGLAALQRRKTLAKRTETRAQARLLFSVLVGAVGIVAALALITVVMIFLHQPGLTLVDPTSGGGAPQPTALLFWFSRLAAVAVAAAALVATRRDGLWFAEWVFSRGLASALVAVLVGGGWVIIRAAVDRLYGRPTAWSAILATAACSVAFLPLYLRVERLVERLLYGSRPTPYRVLADVAALSGSRAGGPDLTAVAEAIGRALGAVSCQLSVLRPGLRDRTYGWDSTSGVKEWAGSLSPDAAGADHLVLPIRQGEKRIGLIAVDRAAVAGLQDERRHLLEDVADSLGAILQASRLSIELERQLRAAVAHAEEIAVSRRTAVAEMDSERRAIERDLHDGAQHHLVTLRLALGLVEHEVSGGQLTSARDRIGQLAEQLDTATAVLAETATGVSSLVLSEEGLLSALRADLAGADLAGADLAGAEPAVTLQDDGVAGLRFGPDVEAAVYFCCLESVNNARKHGEGAPIRVRLGVEGRTLRFEVRDEGPGFTVSASGTAGRGLRNLSARVMAVGGTVRVDSAPGAGTTVRGSVPLAEAPTPHPAGELDTMRVEPRSEAHPAEFAGDAAAEPAITPAPAPAMPGAGSTLLRRVCEVADMAVEHSVGQPDHPQLQRLRARLTEPLRVGVLGPPGAGATTLAAALGAVAPSEVSVLDLSMPREMPDRPVDALVVLLRPGSDRGSLADITERAGVDPRAVAVLAVSGQADEVCGRRPEDRDEAPAATIAREQDPDLRRAGQPVTPVSGLLALAAVELTDADVVALRALGSEPGGPDDLLLERLGPFGVRLSVSLLREGAVADRAQLAAELARRSGLSWLAGALGGQFGRRAQALRARAAMLELEAVLRRSPTTAEEALYQLEALRAGTHELAEIELADMLADGSTVLIGGDRDAALRLLGTADPRITARLGLPDDASPEQVRAAVTEQSAHWRRQAAHPAAGGPVRRAAEILTRTCESLLAELPGRG